MSTDLDDIPNLASMDDSTEQPTNSSFMSSGQHRRNAFTMLSSPMNQDDLNIEFGPANAPGSSSAALSGSFCGFPIGASSDDANDYVGLINQAMTCYLNSLIQTLYMTPEFRNGIYR